MLRTRNARTFRIAVGTLRYRSSPHSNTSMLSALVDIVREGYFGLIALGSLDLDCLLAR